ncbi:unnamed protein product, partial [Discosporangium mesarthrocarpum]
MLMGPNTADVGTSLRFVMRSAEVEYSVGHLDLRLWHSLLSTPGEPVPDRVGPKPHDASFRGSAGVRRCEGFDRSTNLQGIEESRLQTSDSPGGWVHWSADSAKAPTSEISDWQHIGACSSFGPRHSVAFLSEASLSVEVFWDCVGGGNPNAHHLELLPPPIAKECCRGQRAIDPFAHFKASGLRLRVQAKVGPDPISAPASSLSHSSSAAHFAGVCSVEVGSGGETASSPLPGGNHDVASTNTGGGAVAGSGSVSLERLGPNWIGSETRTSGGKTEEPRETAKPMVWGTRLGAMAGGRDSTIAAPLRGNECSVPIPRPSLGTRRQIGVRWRRPMPIEVDVDPFDTMGLRKADDCTNDKDVSERGKSPEAPCLRDPSSGGRNDSTGLPGDNGAKGAEYGARLEGSQKFHMSTRNNSGGCNERAGAGSRSRIWQSWGGSARGRALANVGNERGAQEGVVCGGVDRRSLRSDNLSGPGVDHNFSVGLWLALRLDLLPWFLPLPQQEPIDGNEGEAERLPSIGDLVTSVQAVARIDRFAAAMWRVAGNREAFILDIDRTRFAFFPITTPNNSSPSTEVGNGKENIVEERVGKWGCDNPHHGKSWGASGQSTEQDTDLEISFKPVRLSRLDLESVEGNWGVDNAESHASAATSSAEGKKGAHNSAHPEMGAMFVSLDKTHANPLLGTDFVLRANKLKFRRHSSRSAAHSFTGNSAGG